MTTFCNFISEKSTGIQLLFLQSSWKNMNTNGRVFHKKVDHRERAVERRVLDNWCIAVMNHVGANIGERQGVLRQGNWRTTACTQQSLIETSGAQTNLSARVWTTRSRQ